MSYLLVFVTLQQHQRQMTSVSKGTSSHNHFFATFCIFSGIFLVNYTLINVAANLFYSSGLTLQDVVSLMDQVGLVCIMCLNSPGVF